MRNLNNEIKNKKVDEKKLLSYGFVKKNNLYSYETNIMDDAFQVIITYDGKNLTSKIIETIVEDEYLMADVENTTGEFVGEVKESYQKVIDDVLKNCTVYDAFHSSFSKEVISYVKKKYGDDLEFLWENSENAIWRNPKNEKWYGALLTVSREKFGEESNELVEVLDLRYQKDYILDIIDEKEVFPGYHMNKKSWITIKLDGSVKLPKIKKLIDNSYNIINEPSYWVFPASTKMFDVIGYFQKHDTVTWHKRTNLFVDDYVYIYMGSPISSILFQCIVVEKNEKEVTIKLQETYPEGKYPFQELKEHGLTNIRGPRTISKETVLYLQKKREKD